MAKRILVVDDEVSVGEGLVAVLGLYGYRAAHFESAPAALQAIEESHPDAIVLDVLLDEHDGLALFREVAKRWPDLPVVIVTGSLDDRGLPPESPTVRRLFKPFDSEELLRALAELGV